VTFSGTSYKDRAAFPTATKLSASARNGELATSVSLDSYHYAATAIASYAMLYVLVSNPPLHTSGVSSRWGMVLPSR
jgi:hypothetical protein